MKDPIRDCLRLTQADLLALIGGEYLALRIRNFYNHDLCALLAARITAFDGLRPFRYATHMARFGLSLGEIVGSEEELGAYLKAASDEVAGFRQLCAPFLSPIDMLRLVLDEAWTAGANIATIRQRKAFTGVARIVQEGGSTPPHQDRLVARHVDLSAFVAEQLAANVYLQTSSSGGELELWDLQLSAAEYQAIREPGKAGVTAHSLRPRDLSIAPDTGDLIIFRSTSLHAIQQAGGRPRVTCSSFIGYNSVEKPLVFYC
ncbi:2OG-Fe(II) oxygenase [Variovorax paradoxus]|uniref:2OG-Fe(II) oxygenase n=1 Tax=Variovorax paradoxus TaxID=34073 RepID=UPI002788E143|nr:2OG-Fe(II) oxygenase [Variovorax paradoxus]MDP9933599.1 hypothetical protein [Variovorax paradoxus]